MDARDGSMRQPVWERCPGPVTLQVAYKHADPIGQAVARYADLSAVGTTAH